MVFRPQLLSSYFLVFALSVWPSLSAADMSGTMLVSPALALKIGERLHLSPKEGCASCHNRDGRGGGKAKASNLQSPSTWKSAGVARELRAQGIDGETTRSVAISLISNGAAKWNVNFYKRPEYAAVQNKVFFDEGMIGIHSRALKLNTRIVRRLLKKNKTVVSAKELPRVMAESVYFYLSERIFVE